MGWYTEYMSQSMRSTLKLYLILIVLLFPIIIKNEDLSEEFSEESESEGSPEDSPEGITEVNETPELTTRQYNLTYRIIGPVKGKDIHDQKFKFSALNSTHDVYRVQSFKLLPGKQANSPLMRVGKYVGAIPIIKRGLGVNCWDDIGCFSAINAKEALQGTLGMLPMSPKQIDVKFNVFTVKSQTESFQLDYKFDINQLRGSTFNHTHQTVIVVHGFKSGLAPWMINIKNMLFQLKHNEYNVVLVDWSRGSNIMNYILAASNTQVVGALIAFFVDRICETTYEKKMKNDMFYLIGHSLGAHIMGFAGKRLIKPKVTRITGLDPAGPLFELCPSEARLNYNDANQVDIIHTDMAENAITGLGIFEPIGDMDFYPNGGKLQPGCPQTEMITNVLKYPGQISCSHSRSHSLSNAFGKVDSFCLPVGYMCEHWETFVEGRCGNCDVIEDISRCQLMGLYPTYWKSIYFENKPGVGQKYYFNTAKNGDFCLYHYQVAFHISHDSDKRSNGEIQLILNAEVQNEPKILTINRVISSVYPGKIHTILVTFKFMVKIRSLSLMWLRFRRRFTTGRHIKIDFVEINYLSHISEKVRKSWSVMLCPATNQTSGSELIPDGPHVLFDECENATALPNITALTYQVELMPLTSSKDILSVDYENEDFINKKLFRNKF